MTYHAWNDPGNDGSWIPYQLTDSTLVLGVNVPASNTDSPPPQAPKKSIAKGGESDDVLLQPVPRSEIVPVTLRPQQLKCLGNGCYNQTVSVVAVPISYETKTYGLEPTEHWFVYTHLAPKYQPNTLRLASLEVSVEDKREEAINAIGGILVGSAKLLTPAGGLRSASIEPPQTLNLPVVIDLADAKQAIDQPRDLPGNPGWQYQMRFMDGASAGSYQPTSEIENVHSAVVTSLCRPIAVTLTAPGTELVVGTTVADPEKIVTVPLPPAGTVTFGTLCGADVQMDKATTVGTDRLVSDFFQNVDQLRSAIHAAQHPKKTP